MPLIMTMKKHNDQEKQRSKFSQKDNGTIVTLKLRSPPRNTNGKATDDTKNKKTKKGKEISHC